jgi:hypothetical protein
LLISCWRPLRWAMPTMASNRLVTSRHYALRTLEPSQPQDAGSNPAGAPSPQSFAFRSAACEETAGGRVLRGATALEGPKHAGIRTLVPSIRGTSSSWSRRRQMAEAPSSPTRLTGLDTDRRPEDVSRDTRALAPLAHGIGPAAGESVMGRSPRASPSEPDPRWCRGLLRPGHPAWVPTAGGRCREPKKQHCAQRWSVGPHRRWRLYRR